MSCETLTTSATGFSVSMASLPEGFCPTSMQELANAIAERLFVAPNQEFNSFATGSVEPSSNVGPWLKDCLQWFVFDDATARYVPIPQGFNNMEYFTTPGAGTFVVPANIYKLKISAWGAGGGGSSNDGGGVSGSGGGGGGYGCSIETVTPGQSVAYIIGTGGVGGAAGTAGTATTIFTHSAGGGGGAAAVASSGTGGTATGFVVNINGQNGMCNTGSSTGEGASSGGDAGGGGGAGGTSTSNLSVVATRLGVSPGGGGAGGTTSTTSVGGTGANGGILIEY